MSSLDNCQNLKRVMAGARAMTRGQKGKRAKGQKQKGKGQKGKRAKGKRAKGQKGKRAKGEKGKRAKGKTTNYNFPSRLFLPAGALLLSIQIRAQKNYFIEIFSFNFVFSSCRQWVHWEPFFISEVV